MVDNRNFHPNDIESNWISGGRKYIGFFWEESRQNRRSFTFINFLNSVNLTFCSFRLFSPSTPLFALYVWLRVILIKKRWHRCRIFYSKKGMHETLSAKTNSRKSDFTNTWKYSCTFCTLNNYLFNRNKLIHVEHVYLVKQRLTEIISGDGYLSGHLNEILFIILKIKIYQMTCPVW